MRNKKEFLTQKCCPHLKLTEVPQCKDLSHLKYSTPKTLTIFPNMQKGESVTPHPLPLQIPLPSCEFGIANNANLAYSQIT